MPGLNDSFYIVAFDEDERGEIMPSFEPRQVASREEAMRAVDGLARDHAGVVAWHRRAEPAVGELGPPEIISQRGRIGDFG